MTQIEIYPKKFSSCYHHLTPLRFEKHHRLGDGVNLCQPFSNLFPSVARVRYWKPQMHQALKTFEIIDAIFSYLRDYPPEGYHDHNFPWEYDLLLEYNASTTQENIESKACRMALFRSSLCCKHFSNVALRHLWWNQGTIQNILKLLPGYSFSRSQNILVSSQPV